MFRYKIITSGLVLTATIFSLTAQNPQALEQSIVKAGNARFTVLTPEMIRIEYSDKGAFEDRSTFTVQNRVMESLPSFSSHEDNDFLYIETEKLNLKYRKGSNPKTLPASPDNLTITFNHNGQRVLWYPGKPDPLNLKGTCRTLDGSNGDNKRNELEDGLISRSGWAIIDDSWTAARPDGSRSFALEPDETVGFDWWAERCDPFALDIYFLGYGFDYKKALYDFTQIAGKIPLPPNYVFGYWYSRYASYSDDDYRNLMRDLEENDIPTDVMILDMDWHWNGDPNSSSAGRGGWTGWSWNTNLIKDPVKLLHDIHSNDLRLSLNLHPADGINSIESPEYFNTMKSELNGKYVQNENIAWNLDYPDFTKSFFKNIIRDHESEGVDFWWLDWQQHLTSPYTPGLGETFWCNHVFFNDMKINRHDRRPVIFHRWGGLGSHRYQIGFSGDALINFPTLGFQPYFTATASNVGYAYWGHDLGGHAFTDENIVNDPNLMLRWIQFGVFSPIFRSHATKDDRIERRMWKFKNFPLIQQAVKLRYALFPYIYTMARNTFDTGIGLCRPLYYDYPLEENAYKYEGEYLFGNDILVSPITDSPSDDDKNYKEIWFPEGNWWCASSGKMIEGPCIMNLDFKADEIPYFFRAGAVIPMNPESVRRVTEKPDHIILNSTCGFGGEGALYEDLGDNQDYNVKFGFTKFHHSADEYSETYTIEPRSGDQEGLVQSRSWSLKIHNAISPKQIKINGVQVDTNDWNYNAENKLLIIDIPLTSCSTALNVEINYDENSSGISSLVSPLFKIDYNHNFDILNVDLGEQKSDVNLSIINLAGSVCFNKKFNNISNLQESLAFLQPAIYLCCIEADNSQCFKKICKL